MRNWRQTSFFEVFKRYRRLRHKRSIRIYYNRFEFFLSRKLKRTCEDFAERQSNIALFYYRVYKKMNKSEIALRLCKALQCTKIFIKIDCMGTYNVEYTEKLRNLKF